LLVTYQIDADEVEVVTAYWINEDGLRKYGFTRGFCYLVVVW
jgi:hypothetical protein